MTAGAATNPRQPLPELAMLLRAARIWLPLAPLCACGEPAVDPQLLAETLRAVDARPEEAAARCDALPPGHHRGDCFVAAVEKLAATRPAEAEALCVHLEDGGASDALQECWFQLAERSKDAGLCARSGSFAEDCRVHVWTTLVPGLTADILANEAWSEAALVPVARAASDLGFPQDDPRVWTVVFRHLHHRIGAPAPARCGSVGPAAARWCDEAGLGVYRDQLSFLRDSSQFPCGGPPAEVRTPEGRRWAAVYDALAREVGCPPPGAE